MTATKINRMLREMAQIRPKITKDAKFMLSNNLVFH